MFQDIYLYVLYLFYGLVFFTMGVSITSKVTRGSTLQIARVLWLFSLFAFIHAFHEWSELYMLLGGENITGDLLLTIKSWKLLPVFFSFLFLLFFGIRTLGIVYSSQRRLLYLLPALLLLLLGSSVLAYDGEFSIRFLRWIDCRFRNFIGFPAATFSGLGLILYSTSIRHLSRRGAQSFTGAGIFLIIYGILAGLIPSRTYLWTNTFPIELFRGLSALFIMHFVMNALHIFDIERQQQIEEQLQRFARSEKLSSLGKLAAGIAHEINNPLTNVAMGVSLIKRQLPDPLDPALARRFEAIDLNIDRASKIARELLFFSRNEEPELHPTDLNEVICDTLVLLGSRRQEFSIREDLGKIPLIQAIPWKLEEVFLNILINAMDASPPGSPINVRTFAKDNEVVVEIQDQGTGIPEDCLNRIFDPFFTTKEVGQGTGLGLSICFGIMETHRGRIDVRSAPGQGTSFQLSFPLEKESHV